MELIVKTQRKACALSIFKLKTVAQPITFDYHYLSDPVLSDNRVNATRNVFRAGEDSKNSVFCSVDGRPNDINIDYKQNGGHTFWRDGLFTEAGNLTISCIATNLLSGETKKTDMRIQVLPPLVPDEPESGGASIEMDKYHYRSRSNIRKPNNQKLRFRSKIAHENKL